MTTGVTGLMKGNKIEVFSGEAMFINTNEARLFNEHESPATNSTTVSLLQVPVRSN